MSHAKRQRPMSREQLAVHMGLTGAPAAYRIIDEAVGSQDTEELVKATLGKIIEATVLQTCTRIAQEHIFTSPSEN